MRVSWKIRLKAIMADMGYRSMKALAADTGISANTLYDFEKGGNLTLENLLKVLFVLDCSFDELIKADVIDEPASWDDLSEEEQAAVERALAEKRRITKDSA